MDLQTLHERTGISKRKLRYCLDHRLVPGLNIELAADEAGRPRKFADDVGFGIVCAAKLQDSGLPHETIRRFLAGMMEIELPGPGTPKLALVAILENGLPISGHLGDGMNVRLVADDPSYDSGWRVPGNPAKISADYCPTVEVVLNLKKIRDEVFGSS